MNCVSCNVCVYTTFGLCFLFFPWGFPQLQRDWSLSCDHGTDLIMRVNVRTTTTNNN